MRTYQTIILGSTAAVNIGSANPVGSSSIGTTSVSSTGTSLLPFSPGNGFQPIEFCNGFSLQLNVGNATAGSVTPSGTVNVLGSVDGINFSPIPGLNNTVGGPVSGTSSITFGTSGSFLMMNYSQPAFKYLQANYVGSSSGSVYSLILSSKTF